MKKKPPEIVQKDARANLMLLANTYGKALGLPRSTVSKRCYGNSEFLDKYSQRKQWISLESYDRVLDFFIKNWPEEARWPLLYSIRFPRNGKNTGENFGHRYTGSANRINEAA